MKFIDVPPSLQDSTPILLELIVRLLSRLDSAPPYGVLLGTSGPHIIVGVTSPVHGPNVGFQTPGSSSVTSMAPSRFAVCFASAVMSVAE
ncbi:hypothetical protein H5410_057957 [Solanum commersonii]|uniref:Uncharacterized protein n=1 Tax=Solanum commersonii TaxID=4109 RepID=A0A9J5WRG7_SOLCO|nr:hypothetical protein H5410_057957 [Solanum commersonii]